MNEQKIRPIAGNLLVKPDPPEKVTKGGIVIPQNAAKKLQTGVVLAISRGRVTDHGVLIEHEVRVGDRILAREFNAIQQVDPMRADEAVLVPEGDVVAVIEP